MHCGYISPPSWTREKWKRKSERDISNIYFVNLLICSCIVRSSGITYFDALKSRVWICSARPSRPACIHFTHFRWKMTQFLPPNLLALFAPRDPIPFLPQLVKLPHEKHHNQPYSGIAPFIRHFEVSVQTSCAVVDPHFWGIWPSILSNILIRIPEMPLHRLGQRPVMSDWRERWAISLTFLIFLFQCNFQVYMS